MMFQPSRLRRVEPDGPSDRGISAAESGSPPLLLWLVVALFVSSALVQQLPPGWSGPVGCLVGFGISAVAYVVIRSGLR